MLLNMGTQYVHFAVFEGVLEMGMLQILKKGYVKYFPTSCFYCLLHMVYVLHFLCPVTLLLKWRFLKNHCKVFMLSG